MRFREFCQLENLTGHLGPIKAATGEINLIQKQIKLSKPVTGKGTSVGRMMSAGKVRNPARPALVTSPARPMTIKSNLK